MLEPLHIQGNLFVVSNYPPSIYQEIRKRENPRQNYDAEITAKCFVAGEMDDVIRWDYTRSITLYAGIIREHALHRMTNTINDRSTRVQTRTNAQPGLQTTTTHHHITAATTGFSTCSRPPAP